MTSAEFKGYIPVIDMSKSNEKELSNDLFSAFTKIGFATLINHGINDALLSRAFASSQSFFSLPLDVKIRYKYQSHTSNRGYIPMGTETHDQFNETGESDKKETLDIGPEEDMKCDWTIVTADTHYGNQWPLLSYEEREEICCNDFDAQQFRSTMIEYFSTMDELHMKLLRLLAQAIKLDDAEYFVKRCNTQHQNLRLLHYPTLHFKPSSERKDREPEVVVRGNIHTDFGTLTLLTQDVVGGLRIQTLEEQWINVPPVPNGIAVNVGDMLQRWTNGVLRATPHQVISMIHRTDEEQSQSISTIVIPERYSIAFFCNANRDIMLECLPCCVSAERPVQFDPINAHAFITMRLQQTIATNGADV